VAKIAKPPRRTNIDNVKHVLVFSLFFGVIIFYNKRKAFLLIEKGNPGGKGFLLILTRMNADIF
jgi:hypothetical protein